MTLSWLLAGSRGKSNLESDLESGVESSTARTELILNFSEEPSTRPESRPEHLSTVFDPVRERALLSISYMTTLSFC